MRLWQFSNPDSGSRPAAVIETDMKRGAHPLRQVQVRDIDVDSALHHVDLPVADVYPNRVALVRGLSATKANLLRLFGKVQTLTVWRALEAGLDKLELDDLGQCWSWSSEGALHGSGLDRRERAGILLRVLVSAEEVDWDTTVVANAFSPDEQEVVLQPGADVTLLEVNEVSGHRIGTDITPAALRGRHCSV